MRVARASLTRLAGRGAGEERESARARERERVSEREREREGRAHPLALSLSLSLFFSRERERERASEREREGQREGEREDLRVRGHGAGADVASPGIRSRVGQHLEVDPPCRQAKFHRGGGGERTRERGAHARALTNHPGADLACNQPGAVTLPPNQGTPHHTTLRHATPRLS